MVDSIGNIIPDLQSDFITAILRSEIESLQKILSYVEGNQHIEGQYLSMELKRRERSIHRLRKFCDAY